MPLPILALIGRPNVGKSTIFNRLTGSREALVTDTPGLTRDRRYGTAQFNERDVTLVDTPGISDDPDEPLADAMRVQSLRAVEEAELVVHICDATDGLLPSDEDIIQELREAGKPTLLVVNKIDRHDEHLALADFSRLGLGVPILISAAHGRGMSHFGEVISNLLPAEATAEEKPPISDDEAGFETNHPLPVAIVGRPNVGKSTLINQLLGEERVLVSAIAGTTHDNVDIALQRDGSNYLLIDTAGVRRQGKTNAVVEKFSVARSLAAIRRAHVAVLIIDGSEGLVAQDLRLINKALTTGRSIVLAVNKWDQADADQKTHIKNELDRRLTFARHLSVCFISALKGSGMKRLFRLINATGVNTAKTLKTPELNNILADLTTRHPPPLGPSGRRIKLRYAHSGGTAPPIIVIHGSRVDALTESYRTYLEKGFRQALGLAGTVIRLEFRQAANPYADRKNTLTPAQLRNRNRLIRHSKKRR